MLVRDSNCRDGLDISALWQFCLEFEYDADTLTSGISSWLQATRAKDILDCACGTGFPALDLIKRGFQLTCTDGSEAMLSKFHDKARKERVSARATRVLWKDLHHHYPNYFDVVMCRGNSLIYADGWEECRAPGYDVIKEALVSFRRCLRPDGRLYVDTTSASNLARPDPEEIVYPTRRVGNLDIKLSETVVTDRVRRTRTWTSVLTVNGEPHEFRRQSYFLLHEELIGLLRDTGFEDIRQESILGEHYAVFSAKTSPRISL